MADQDPPIEQWLGGPETTPQVGVLTQYIKDLSVESPARRRCSNGRRSRRSTSSSTSTSRKVVDEVHEVILKINVGAASDKGVHFLVDLSYAGLFGLRNLPKTRSAPFLLVEAPRLLFPFAARSSPTRSRTPASRRCCSSRSTSPAPIWRSSAQQQAREWVERRRTSGGEPPAERRRPATHHQSA